VAGLTGKARQGAEVYVTLSCWRCHAIEGVGGQNGPSLTNVGARLDQSEIVTTILTGRGNMPAFGRTISPDQLDQLVAFLSTLRGGPGSPPARRENAGLDTISSP